MRNHNEEPVGIDGNQIFGVVRFRDADDTYCFVTPSNTFFSVCHMYCETVKDHVGEYPLDSLGDGWWERDAIPEPVFNVLCEAQPYSDQVAVVADFDENAASETAGLMLGDRIVEVDGRNVHIADDLLYEIMRLGIEPVDLTVVRDGEKVTVPDVSFPQISEEGVAFGINDFRVHVEEKNFSALCRHSFWRSGYTVRMIWESLYDLFTGRYGVQAVSGPVGVTEALTEAASTGAYNFVSLLTIISINLGVMNLLPLPALDGGRIVFLLIELVRRKPLKPQIEAYINAAGLAVLLLLMLLICVKDIVGLF